MAIITQPAKESLVFYQGWSDKNEMPGESAIVINVYDTELELVQEDRAILLSRHEISDFIKLLKGLKSK